MPGCANFGGFRRLPPDSTPQRLRLQDSRPSRHIKYFVNNDSSLFGKRIRITGWMKTSDVFTQLGRRGYACREHGRAHLLLFDGMFDRPLHGTTGWQQVEFVTDVPRSPASIALSPTLCGTGEMWFDDFQIDIVPSNTLTTDDRDLERSEPGCPSIILETRWMTTRDAQRASGSLPRLYFARTCTQVCRFVAVGQHNRDIKNSTNFWVKTVRMSVWVGC